MYKPPFALTGPAEFTVPVNDGDSSGAFKFNAVCVAVDIGISMSAVLSTLPNPTIALVIPETVDVNVFGPVSTRQSTINCINIGSIY